MHPPVWKAIGKIIRDGLRSSAGLMAKDINQAANLLHGIEKTKSRIDTLAVVILMNRGKINVESFVQQLTSAHSHVLFTENQYGCNAAHRACINGFDDTVALHFLQGMFQRDPEVIDKRAGKAYKQRTCLHLATDKRLHRVLEWLLERNANMEQKDEDGKTAWDIAFEGNDSVAMSMFATYHVARQVGDDERRAVLNERNDIENNQVKNEKIESNEVESNEVESNEIESSEVGGNAAKSNEAESNEVKNEKVRRHWFRVGEGIHSIQLEKHSDPSGTLGFTNKRTFKLFTISENKASSSRPPHHIYR
jgi:hypothetical protein